VQKEKANKTKQMEKGNKIKNENANEVRKKQMKLK